MFENEKICNLHTFCVDPPKSLHLLWFPMICIKREHLLVVWARATSIPDRLLVLSDQIMYAKTSRDVNVLAHRSTPIRLPGVQQLLVGLSFYIMPKQLSFISVLDLKKYTPSIEWWTLILCHHILSRASDCNPSNWYFVCLLLDCDFWACRVT